VTRALILMGVAGFSMGGAIAFHRQGRPLWASAVLVVVALALLYLGSATARGA